MGKLDALDDAIIKILERDAWLDSEMLANKLQVSSSTIRRRIKRLKQTGVLRAVAVVDVSKTGIPLTAMIALDVEGQNIDTVIKVVAGLRPVKWVATTTGRFDIIALARFRSNVELSEFITGQLMKVKGIKDSETFVCLHVIWSEAITY